MSKARVVQEPFADYLASDALNFSTIKVARKYSFLHARSKQLHPDPQTEAKKQGRAVHSAIFEPDVFDLAWSAPPLPIDGGKATATGRADRTTKKGLKAWAMWEAEHPTQEAMEFPQWNACMALREKVKVHETLGAILGCPGHNELSIYWTDDESGLECKARIDFARVWDRGPTDLFNDGETIVGDLKTSAGDDWRNADEWSFSGAIGDMEYDLQFAFYERALNEVQERPRRFVWVVAECQRPYEIRMYEPVDALMEDARTDVRTLLDRWAECKAKDFWPGYDQGITWIDRRHKRRR